MTDEVLKTEITGAVATVTLARPNQFNAFNAQLRAALRKAIDDLERDDTVRIVILKGEGRGFCAGADLAEGMHPPVSGHLETEYKPLLVAIANSANLWIAQVHGSAAGIGAAFAMNCDLVTMADDANVYMAFAAIALVPDGGNTWLLLNQMGYHRAMQAIIEGEKISGQDCLRYGIANKLFAADELDAATLAWAQSLAQRAPLAMSAVKRLLRNVGHMSYDQAITAEGAEQDPLVESGDFRAAVKAFFDKQKPVFQGK